MEVTRHLLELRVLQHELLRAAGKGRHLVALCERSAYRECARALRGTDDEDAHVLGGLMHLRVWPFWGESGPFGARLPAPLPSLHHPQCPLSSPLKEP